MEARECSYQFRIALLGDAAVGKTSLLRRYVAGAPGASEREPGPEPEPEGAPTVGVEFYSRKLQLRAGPRVKLQLWDTAGHERFRCGRGGGERPGGGRCPRPPRLPPPPDGVGLTAQAQVWRMPWSPVPHSESFHEGSQWPESGTLGGQKGPARETWRDVGPNSWESPRSRPGGVREPSKEERFGWAWKDV